MNSKLISEKVDYYIDMLMLNECECNMQNEEENIDECEECDKNINEELEDVDEQAAMAQHLMGEISRLRSAATANPKLAPGIAKHIQDLTARLHSL